MSGEERNYTTDKILYKRNNILKDTIRGCSWESAENILKYTENVCKHSPVGILNIRFEQNIRSDTSRGVTDVLQSAYHLNLCLTWFLVLLMNSVKVCKTDPHTGR